MSDRLHKKVIRLALKAIKNGRKRGNVSLFLKLIAEEIRELKSMGLSYTELQAYLLDRYKVRISQRTIRRFFKHSPNSQTLRSNFCKNSNEADGVSCSIKKTASHPATSPEHRGRGETEAAKAPAPKIEKEIDTSFGENKQPTTPPSASQKEKENKNHELAPIGVERKYSLEELFPDEDDRFDVYALTLVDGLDQEVEDEEIEEIFDLIKYRIGLEDTDDRVRDHEKIRHYLDLMWRMLKLGYTYDPINRKYDDRFEKIERTAFHERARIERELGLFQKLDKPRRHANISLDRRKVWKIKENWLQRNLEKVGIRKKEE